jgi:mannose-6-phosphate isomerase-like protein (cupin superfamily)
MSPQPHLPPLSVAADDAPAYWLVGVLWNVVLSAENTAGQLTMMDQLMPKDSGPPPHIHERYDEGFFIIEGEVEYVVGVGDEQQTIRAGNGASVWIPRGTLHAFQVKSETARALNFYTPGGFDESISYLATPTTAKTLPPSDSGEGDPGGFPNDPEKQQAYLERIGELHSQTWRAEWGRP